MSETQFSGNEKWFKGNLHCHSTVSDGILSPEEVVKLYRSNGYDFLALTDHEMFTNFQEFSDDEFLIIPGLEVAFEISKPGRCHHIVGIHSGEKDAPVPKRMERYKQPDLKDTEKAQQVIDDLKSFGYPSIYCHPIWSRVEFEDIRDIEGFFAMEIYNHGTAVSCHTGLATVYWDSFLRRGRRVWGVATDDAHHYAKDSCGGWVMVNASDLSVESIVDAMMKGAFYSSSGPSIMRYEIEDGRVVVECSPVHAIHFVVYERPGGSHTATDDGYVDHAAYKLRGDEVFVRVECVDKTGKTAWTNPIFING